MNKLPRVQASNAHPAPVAPPPMIRTSYSLVFFNVFTCSSLVGKGLFNGRGLHTSACTY